MGVKKLNPKNVQNNSNLNRKIIFYSRLERWILAKAELFEKIELLKVIFS